MRLYLYLAGAVLVAVSGLLGWMWWVQNSSRTVELSFRLTRTLAWELAQPVSVPVLIVCSFGAGLVLGAALLAGRSLSLSAENRRLRQELALSGGSKSTSW